MFYKWMKFVGSFFFRNCNFINSQNIYTYIYLQIDEIVISLLSKIYFLQIDELVISLISKTIYFFTN